jgi:hypothetical protein
MTFDQICELEPRLRKLYDEIPRLLPSLMEAENGNFWMCWSRLKAMMSALVGWSAENERVQSPQCYDVAYSACFDRAESCAPCPRPSRFA